MLSKLRTGVYSCKSLTLTLEAREDVLDAMMLAEMGLIVWEIDTGDGCCAGAQGQIWRSSCPSYVILHPLPSGTDKLRVWLRTDGPLETRSTNEDSICRLGFECTLIRPE